MPLGESQSKSSDEGENQVRGQGELRVEPPAAGRPKVCGHVHDHGEPDGPHRGPQDDRDQHPPVRDVGGQPAGKDHEARVVKDRDSHEKRIPGRPTGVEPHGEEAGEERGRQEKLHGQGGRDDCLEKRGDLSHGARLGFLGGEHALGQAEVARHGEAEDRGQRHHAQAADDDTQGNDRLPKW